MRLVRAQKVNHVYRMLTGCVQTCNAVRVRIEPADRHTNSLRNVPLPAHSKKKKANKGIIWVSRKTRIIKFYDYCRLLLLLLPFLPSTRVPGLEASSRSVRRDCVLSFVDRSARTGIVRNVFSNIS